MILSKSLYTKNIQCSKALWLKKYKPSALILPNQQTQAIFEIGNIVKSADDSHLNTLEEFLNDLNDQNPKEE